MSASSGAPQREATITIRQQPNGYWHAKVDAIIPGIGYCEDSGDSFHDAGECLQWAQERLQSYVMSATGWFMR